jgi:hypothetical protein
LTYSPIRLCNGLSRLTSMSRCSQCVRKKLHSEHVKCYGELKDCSSER